MSTDEQMTKNFKRSEFACQCGCGADRISLPLVYKLQSVRDMYGKPIIINSGVRCVAHNIAVGGSENSEHIPDSEGIGEAADVSCTNSSDRYVLLPLLHNHFRRLGPKEKFIHCGVRASKAQDVMWLGKTPQPLKSMSKGYMTNGDGVK